MRWLLLAIALSLTGCLQLATTGTDAGTGAGSGKGGASSSSSGSSSGGAAGGTNCTTDPQSGVTLCEQISNCPGVDVDPGSFPGCGFRLHASSVYDLECGCGDSLCPIGTPVSCATALQLLEQQQSSVVVCQQLDQGSCLPLATDAGGAPSSTGTCDKTCESQCAGDPSCYQLCGC